MPVFLFTTDLGVKSSLVTSEGDDVTLTDPCLSGLGGGRGRFPNLSLSSASAGSESFFSTGGFAIDPGPAGISSPKGDLPSDFDLRCMGRGGAGGFISPVFLGAGGTGGARRFTTSGVGRVLPSGGDGLTADPGSSNFGLAGRGGRGTSTPKRLSRSRLTEEQRIGGTGGGESEGSTTAPSALKMKTTVTLITA